MLQINILYLSALRLKLYFNFMRRVSEIINTSPVIDEKFPYYTNQFKAAFNRLNSAYLKYDPDFFTSQLQEADQERSFEFRRLREMIRYQSIYAETDEKKLAAGRLLKITDLYGGSSIVNQNVGAMTTSITNLVEDFEDNHQAEINLLGIAGLVEGLKLAQEKYDRLYMERMEFDAKHGKKAVEEARRAMDEAYRDLVETVNLAAKRDEEGELTDFIRLMNVEIGVNRTHTGQGQVDSTDTDSSETDENGVLYKFATFEFKNGESVKLRIEVGTVLAAPTNTEAYKWSPEVPEFMPNRNIVFREVPIETREATATFHFFDHREEIIKQVIGTALTAPENTIGYYWDPTVPATMPAEDTAYYELPTEDNENTGGDNTGGDNTGGDNTGGDNTGGDNTGGDNTGGDNTGGGNTGGGSAQKYTVTYWHNGAVYTTQEVEAGQRIQLPAAPEGYRWTNIPPQMPAQNITITSQEIGPDDF